MYIKHNYKVLANAIIKQAVDDYCSNICSEREFKRFIFSDYYLLLTDINPDYLYRKANEKKSLVV